MRRPTWQHVMAAFALGWTLAAKASDDAALGLQAAEPDKAQPAAGSNARLVLELAAGRLSQRYGLGSADARRSSLDLSVSTQLGGGWRAALSDRLDDIHPPGAGGRSTLNSLREAYVGWQDRSGLLSFDLGRINLRNGPAYGFNPTDYLRDGANRALTTADPVAQRDNRLGSVMVRASRLWQGGSAQLAWMPKLRDAPSNESFSADLGATNHADRALLALGGKLGERVDLQGFVYHHDQRGTQLGANGTALLSDAAVGYFEWSGGRDVAPQDQITGVNKRQTAHRAVAGVTYTLPSRLALSAEWQYDGFAARRNSSLSGPGADWVDTMGSYLLEVQRRQDIASRQALTMYATLPDAFVKKLHLTGLLRLNTHDHSRFAWMEARWRGQGVDLALQWQASQGKAASEYGGSPTRSLVQALVAFYY